MKLIYKEYILNEVTIDQVSADVQDYLNNRHTERHSVQRIRLTVEELLLNLLAHFGSGMMISVGLGKQFGRHMFRLRYEAEPFNPSDSGDDPLTDDILRSLGLSPAWSYRGKSNTVSLVLLNRPKHSMLFFILLAVITAVILGVFGNAIPEDVRQNVIDAVLSPLSDCFLGLLNTFAGLMIFLTICNGILGMGDPATLGRTGKTVIIRFAGILFIISAVSAARKA